MSLHRLVRTAAIGPALAVCAAAPAAAAPLTAAQIRFGDAPATLRIVVDLAGSAAPPGVAVTDAAPLDGRSRIRVTAPGVRSAVGRRGAGGVTAGFVQGHGHIDLAIAVAPLAFKAVSTTVLAQPLRVVVDLWKAAPPANDAVTLRAPDGCLALTAVTTTQARVVVQGTERSLPGHRLRVGLRRADGSTLVQRAITATTGTWQASLPYVVATSQPGTIEAFGLRPDDGALTCIVQDFVRLRPAGAERTTTPRAQAAGRR